MKNYNYRSVDKAETAVMSRVYLCMTLGLLISGLVAYLFATTPDLTNLLYKLNVENQMTLSGVGWVVLLAPLAMIFGFSWVMEQSVNTVMLYFGVFCALMGASLSSIFLTYTESSIMSVFFLSSGMFAGMSLWGFITKKDLSGMGSILGMALWGIILAMLVNFFLQSSRMDFIISIIGVIVFCGLTAHDTQYIKNMLNESYDEDSAGKIAIAGALKLYLDFLNLFLFLLRIFGQRK